MEDSSTASSVFYKYQHAEEPEDPCKTSYYWAIKKFDSQKLAMCQSTHNNHDHSLNWNGRWYQLAKALNNLILIQMYQIFTDQKVSETQIIKQYWNAVTNYGT